MHCALRTMHYALRTMHYALCTIYVLRTIAHNFNPWSPPLIWLKVARPPSSCNLGNSGCIRFTNSSMTFIHANSSDGLFKVELIERATTTSMDDHLMIYSKSLTIQKLYQKYQVYVIEWFYIKEIVMFDQQRRYDREELTQILEVSVLQFLAMLKHVKFCLMIPIFCVLRSTFEVFALSWDSRNTKDDKQVSLGWTMR